MSEIDPAALSRLDPSQNSETPAAATKSLPNSQIAASKSGKPLPAAPRVDLEPFYTEIKIAIGENWTTYKDALSRFVLGCLNQVELSTVVEPFIFVDPRRESLHNQLICGLYANTLRDAPDASVAPWVSANDKPTTAPKPVSGDATEQRLKQEIMHLPARMRHRIKGIRDEPHKPLIATLTATARALAMNPTTGQPSATPHSAVDPSSSTATGLNRDLEIRRRYNLPLICEIHDLPGPNTLHDRILPICYEEGLSNGMGNPYSCADLLSSALGVFVKDTLSVWLSRARCDMPSSNPPLIPSSTEGIKAAPSEAGAGWGGLDRAGLGIKTGAYKRRLEGEESSWQRGAVNRSESGLFPVESETAREIGRGRSAPGDVALTWELGDEALKGMAPWLGERILVDLATQMWEMSDSGIELEDGDGRRNGAKGPERNGANARLFNGDLEGRMTNVTVDGTKGIGRQTVNDDEDWTWQGARKIDQQALDNLLDECLDF